MNNNCPDLANRVPGTGAICAGGFLNGESCFALSIFDNLSDHVAILDEEGTIIAVNRTWRSFAEAHGMRLPDAGVGSNYLQICRSARGEAGNEANQVADGIISLLVAQEGGFLCEYPCHDTAEQRWFQVIGNCFRRDGRAYLIVSHQNITRIRKLADQVQRREERLDLALRAAREGIWDWDLETGEVYYSPRYKEMLGYAEDEIECHVSTWRRLLHPDDLDHANEVVAAVLRGEQQYEMEFRLLCKDGGFLPVLSRGYPVRRASDGQIIRIVGTHLDLTEQRQREAELTRAKDAAEAGNRAKSDFLAIMSHELRTPLNSILGNGEILRDELLGSLNPQQQRLLRTIDESGRHLLALINDILDFARIEAGKLEVTKEPVDLVEVCDTCLQTIKEQAFMKKVTVSFSPNLVMIQYRIDRLHLKQILVNLLTNAVKFTPVGGSVELGVEDEPLKQRLRFTVRDTGIGIASDDLKKLFQPFMQLDSSLTRRYEGTGLGLALVARLTALMGGEISVESEPGVGSRFVVTLPYLSGAKESLPDTSITSCELCDVSGTDSAPESPLMLMVDDNPTNNEMLAVYFSLKGYRTRIANSGEEAVATARELLPEVILMDIQMPGLGGLEAIRNIRALPGSDSTVIIALTVLAMPGDRQRCLDAGADDYLTKPVRLEELLTLIKLLHENKRQGCA